MLFRFPVCSSDDGQSGGGGGSTPATPPVADATTPVTTPAVVTPAPADAGAQPSHRDWGQMAVTMRKILEKLDQPAPVAPAPAARPAAAATPTTADAVSEVAAMRRELELRDAMDAAGVDPKNRATVKRLYAAEQPQDLNSWLDGAMKDFGWKAGSAAASIPVAPAPVSTAVNPASAPSNTGPPAGNGAPTLDPNPMKWPREVLEAMSPEDRKSAMDKYVRNLGGYVDPFADKSPKLGAGNNSSVDALAAALVKKLKDG